MGIAWCRERLEQAQNSKNPVDRILIRCSNVMKPKTYFRSQDRLAEDVIYSGSRSAEFSSNVRVPPPRSRLRPRSSDWHTCTLTVPDAAPVPPPRTKRKRKLSEEILEQKTLGEIEGVVNSGNEQKRQNRFIKLSEDRVRVDFHGSGAGKEKPKNDYRKREQKRKVVKNVSSLSLPNYNELVKPTGKVSGDAENADDKTENPSGHNKAPSRNQSSVSLPGEGSNSILSTLSEATIHRLETYMKKCRSFGSLKPQQLLEKLEEVSKHRPPSESSDSWSGLDDWDLGVIEYCDPETAEEPVIPKSRLQPKTAFAVGTPPRSWSPTVEASKTETIQETVPDAWFSDTEPVFSDSEPPEQPTEKSTKTPPPSPANGSADAVTGNDHTFAEVLPKYEDSLVEIEIGEQKPKRNRSSSVMEVKLNLPHADRFSKRLSIGCESSDIEKEFLANPERVLNGLRRASLFENLPEDPFDVYVRRKRTSLSESLSQFLGFNQEQSSLPDDNKSFDSTAEEGPKTSEPEEKPPPPPLPSNPPPGQVSFPLVTITCDSDSESKA